MPSRLKTRSPRRQAYPHWRDKALLATCVVMLAVSGGMLWFAGFNYEGLTGSVATKIHPFTYAIAVLFLADAFYSGDPIAYVVESGRMRPASLLLLVSASLLFLHIILRAGPGLAGTLDTFIGPPLLMLLLARTGEPGLRQLEIALHVAMTVNALMGIGEFVSKTLIFPYRFDGEVFPTDHRSAALQGHPLTNASFTAWYMLALLNGGRVMPQNWKLPLFGLQFAALVTFGGRSAMVVVAIFGGAYLLVMGHKVLRAGRVGLLAAAVAAFLLICLPVTIAGLAFSGFFDALLERFVSDGGSANARVQMFALFSQLPFRDLLVGPDASLVDSLRRMEGLEWGIENPVIRTVLYQGIIATVLMTAAVVLFHFEIAACGERGVWLPMLAFVLLMQTSESLGGKTTMMSKFALTIVCMYRPVPRNRHSAPGRSSALAISGSNLRVVSSIAPKPSNRFQNAQGRPNASAVSRTSRI